MTHDRRTFLKTAGVAVSAGVLGGADQSLGIKTDQGILDVRRAETAFKLKAPTTITLRIECRVNGEVCQSSNTSDMVVNCASLVSYISKHFTLKPGDRLTSTIEKLGELHFALA